MPMIILLTSSGYFNPHPRTEGDNGCRRASQKALRDFNPHPRTEGDGSHLCQENVFPISSHTLAPGVSVYVDARDISSNISTHTLARRVTARRTRTRLPPSNFNPHPRTEGDSTWCDYKNKHPISTHTLARRVTGLFPAT